MMFDRVGESDDNFPASKREGMENYTEFINDSRVLEDDDNGGDGDNDDLLVYSFKERENYTELVRASMLNDYVENYVENNDATVKDNEEC